MWIYLLQGGTLGLSAAVTPGPLAMFVVSRAIADGWRRALPAAFAPLISDGPIAILVLALLSQVPARMILSLRLLGGAFILYLALRTWKARSESGSNNRFAPQRSNALKAAAINWLNPNPYISWSVIMGPILIDGLRTSPAHGIAFLAGFYVLMILVMIGMILLASAGARMGSRVQGILITLSSAALACFGIHQLWTAGAALW